jgi:hypothetical protein
MHPRWVLLPMPAILAFWLAAAPADPPKPGFPGAEGFGAATPGGRGGWTIEVTNLNDSGPGSLREACAAKGPRIVVFRVSCVIDLQTPVRVTEPHLTIAGQTAPGEGKQNSGTDCGHSGDRRSSPPALRVNSTAAD